MLSRAARELLEEGRLEGRLEGEARALTRILERRFKALPADVAARIASAAPHELEPWLDRSVEAATLDDVFSEPAHR